MVLNWRSGEEQPSRKNLLDGDVDGRLGQAEEPSRRLNPGRKVVFSISRVIHPSFEGNLGSMFCIGFKFTSNDDEELRTKESRECEVINMTMLVSFCKLHEKVSMNRHHQAGRVGFAKCA